MRNRSQSGPLSEAEARNIIQNQGELCQTEEGAELVLDALVALGYGRWAIEERNGVAEKTFVLDPKA